MSFVGTDEFTRLVSEHVDFVYSAALRQVRHHEQAEDVTQAVFIILANKGRGIPEAGLPGWLFKTTRYVARNAMRMECRRKIHEREAALQRPEPRGDDASWTLVAGELDEAMASLGRSERDVILLHYFNGRTLAEAAAALGISHEAARKRASRAIDHLRNVLGARGLTMSAAALGGMLAANSVQAAPVTLKPLVLSAARGTAGTTATANTLAQQAIQHKALLVMKIGAVAAIISIVAVGILFANGSNAPGRSRMTSNPSAEAPDATNVKYSPR